MSPAVADRFFTTEPLGKPWNYVLCNSFPGLSGLLWPQEWSARDPGGNKGVATLSKGAPLSRCRAAGSLWGGGRYLLWEHSPVAEALPSLQILAHLPMFLPACWTTATSAYSHLNKNSLVQFGCSVVSDSLRPHEPQHARPPCPSPNPGVYPNPCPLSRWCHPTISSSVVPFSSCPQSFPASGFFSNESALPTGGQSIGVSASTSILPMNTQDWSPLGWTGWISMQSKGLSRVFSNTTIQKHQGWYTGKT